MSVPAPVNAAVIERGRPWIRCNGQQLKILFQAGLAWLDANHKVIDDLNVFPVPDGDSGTNMLLTMQSAYSEIAKSPSKSASDILQGIAKGSLMGARGNSGVILSQFFRGIADSVDHAEAVDAAGFATALQAGARLAYQGVQKPVEGTILTVARDLSDAAAQATAESEDLYYMLTAVVAEAQRSVARTPEIFPLLAKAGVVDAGGQGLYVILQGALKFLNGEDLSSGITAHTQAAIGGLSAEEGWGFDIQFILRGHNLNVDHIRRRIESLGESVLVVGDSNLVKVHAHAPTPGPILDYGATCGVMSKIIVENMEEQYQEILLGRSKPPIAAEAISGIATVVVASGAGIQRVFESLGASRIVGGGATMNPSVEDILKAIEGVHAQNAIVLPNDKNVILGAQQAGRLTHKVVRVVPSITIPQGIAALLAYNFQADLDANAEAMSRALKTVDTGEITRAVRSVSIDGLDVQQGQIIGLHNGILCVAGDDLNRVAMDLLGRMTVRQAEVVTIYFGRGVPAGVGDRLVAEVRKVYPHIQVDAVDGGQPHTHYILSAE